VESGDLDVKIENLYEGGNVFKQVDKTPLTRRILTGEIPDTVGWLEQITGLDFTLDRDETDVPIRWLGTTGRKKGTDKEPGSSGDLDLSVDESEVSKDDLIARLAAWCRQQGIPDEQILNTAKDKTRWIEKSGDNVHFRTPIKGNLNNGFAQTDFMFSPDPVWQQFAMRGGREGSAFTGESRAIILASIISALHPGLKYSYKHGLVDRATNTTIENGKNPATISKLTGIPVAKLNTADDILDAVSKRPNYDQLVAAARETLSKSDIQLPEAAPLPGTAAWFRTHSDKFK
jgi:hypothetical protein